MERVLIIFGGHSTEYEVSLNSAASVIKAVDKGRYEVLLLGITKAGQALYYEGSVEKLKGEEWTKEACYPATISMSRGTPMLWVEKGGTLLKIPFHIAFPVLHGKNGEDGTLQGLCELAGIPIAGCDMEGSMIGMDKVLAHTLVNMAGIAVPKGICLERIEEYKEKEQSIRKLGLPVFVKPVRAGSSFGISKVTEEAQLYAAIEEAFSHDGRVVIEEAVEGFEVGCAVMGNDKLCIGRVDEIELSEGFFNYEEKYTLKTSAIHMPVRLPEEEEARIKETAAKIYRCLGLRGFSRVDMFYTDQKEIVFNEVNTIPGFTDHSRFPNMMKGIGRSFEDVVNEILSLAKEQAG